MPCGGRYTSIFSVFGSTLASPPLVVVMLNQMLPAASRVMPSSLPLADSRESTGANCGAVKFFKVPKSGGLAANTHGMWKDGKLSLLIKDIPNTNGLAFSPGEKILYVNGSRDRYVKAYDVKPDGTLANGRMTPMRI